MRLRKPGVGPWRCSRRPLMVSVGPLLVSGWSKECEDVGGLLLQGPSEGSGLGQAGWDSMGEFGDQGLHLGLARGGVGFAVGGDHLLVDVLGGLDLDMVIVGEQRLEGGLVVARSVVRCWCGGAAGPEQGIVGPAVVPVEFLLDAVPVLVRGVPGEAGDVEWVHHRCRGREFLAGGGLEPGEPVHRDHLHPIAPCFGAWCQPRLERGLGVALDHVEQPGRSGPGPDRGQVA